MKYCHSILNVFTVLFLTGILVLHPFKLQLIYVWSRLGIAAMIGLTTTGTIAGIVDFVLQTI